MTIAMNLPDPGRCRQPTSLWRPGSVAVRAVLCALAGLGGLAGLVAAPLAMAAAPADGLGATAMLDLALANPAPMVGVVSNELAATPAPAEPRFDLSVNNAPAAQVFLQLASGTRYNMLVAPEVSGSLSITLKDTTLPEALDTLRELFGYDFRISGNRVFVYSNAVQSRLYRINYLPVLPVLPWPPPATEIALDVTRMSEAPWRRPGR